jgi:uncharacterized membrane protein YhaH (DUF805 family)
MGFGEAISSGFSNYVNFSSRAARSEYWFWALFFALVYLVTAIIDVLIMSAGNGGIGVLSGLAALALFLPSLAVTIRRLHDLDRSGWWVFLGFVPLVGGIILLIWYCSKGTDGSNRFGPDPLAGHA